MTFNNKFLIVIAVISVLFNVFLFLIVLNKGIVIDKRIDKRSFTEMHNEQFQGQMMINQYYHKGNKITWKYLNFNNVLDLTNHLNTIHPTSSYFCKVVKLSQKWIIIYPKFMEKKNK